MRGRLVSEFTQRLVAALLVGAAAQAESSADLSGVRAAPLRDRNLGDALSDAARAPRALRVETQPPGARVEIAYLRDGVQLARGAGEAPLVAQLPPRARAGERDRVSVRAEAAGFAATERSLRAREIERAVRIELAPLPPSELRVSLLALGDVAELRIAADRKLGARLARSESADRFVFSDLAGADAFAAQLGAVRGAVIASARAARLGADLAFEIERSARFAGHDLRLFTSEAASGGAHVFRARWLPADRGAAMREHAAGALASLRASEVSGCALVFERELRAELSGDALARVLSDEDSFARELVALALARVAELSKRNEVHLVDGTRLHFARALEREAASVRAGEVDGALAAIRALATSLAPTGENRHALHAWLAPDLSHSRFSAALEQAATAERNCAASQ